MAFRSKNCCMESYAHFSLRNKKDGFVTFDDETVHDVCPYKFKTEKKYKEQKSKEIIAAICAVLNSNGGKVTLTCESKIHSTKCLSTVSRMLEQLIISIIGPVLATTKICMEEKEESLIIHVKKANYLITTSYNLYLPTGTQVVQLDPREKLENVKKAIINRRIVPEPVELGSHQNTFRKGKDCGFGESKMCQFKQLVSVSSQSKRTTLADRMTGKSNKFSCYVSAFANHKGGHIYYGILDDGVVEGEVLSNEKDKRDIIKKVEKTINKMIWPEKTGQPKRGEHWDIFFESVLDENSTTIPSTFVIVIFIAPCLGGVFTEEPECYEIFEGNVDKMSFITWERKTMQVDFLNDERESHEGRTTWSSRKAQEAFTDGHKKIMPLINNGDWKNIFKKVETDEAATIHKLQFLSKQVTACIRGGRLNKAHKLLEQYKHTVVLSGDEVKDKCFFEEIELYLEAALTRASAGDLKKTKLKELLSKALSQAEKVEQGLVTATILVFAATVTDEVGLGLSPHDLSTRALVHLRSLHCVTDSSKLVAAIKKKIYMILATFQLGYSINGRCIKKNIGRSSLKKACTLIEGVKKSVLEGNPLSNYHEIQFKLVQSIYHYRDSQFKPEERTRLLTVAFVYAEKAERLAKHKFPEMVEWSRANKALFTEELVRTGLLSVKIRARQEDD